MNTRIRKLIALPAATVLALTLAACGDDSSDDKSSGSDKSSSSTSESSATDETSPSTDASSEGTGGGDAVTPGSQPGLKDGVLTGTGYAYKAPADWADQTEVAKKTVPQIDSTVARKDDKDGFADNVTVVVINPAPIKSIDDIPSTLEGSLSGTDFQDLGKTTVGGEDASHIVASPNVPNGTGGSYELERYDVLKDGTLYGIEFSFSKDTSEADRRAVADEVIGSWAWSG